MRVLQESAHRRGGPVPLDVLGNQVSVNRIGEQSLPHRGVGHQLAGHTGRDRAHPGQLTGGVVDADQARQGDGDLPHQATTTTGVLLGAGEQVVGGVEPQLIQAAGAALGLPLAGEGVDGGVAGSGLLHRADQPEDALAVGGVGVVPDPPLRSGVRGGLFGPAGIGRQHRPRSPPRPLPHRPPRTGRAQALGVRGQQFLHHSGA